MDGLKFFSKITAGDTLKFSDRLANHPASAGNSVTFRLVPQSSGAAVIVISSAPDGDGFTFLSSASTTSAWTPGVYAWSKIVSGPDGRKTIDQGTTTIDPDPAQLSPGFDGRSPNKKTLDAIIAVIDRRASLDQERYKINNRELWRTPIDDLLSLRGFFSALVAQEDAKASGRSIFGKSVKVRF